jgi:AcrR family transcriptional regulator
MTTLQTVDFVAKRNLRIPGRSSARRSRRLRLERAHSTYVEHPNRGKEECILRPSKRNDLLKASLAVLDEEGIVNLTLDRVAEQAGLTRAGLLYHFADRESLLLSVYEYVAERWDRTLTELAGKPSEECTDYERLRAQIFTGVHRASHAELQLMHHAVTNPEVAKPLGDVLERWGVCTSFSDPAKTFVWTTAFLAAHGMWMSDSVGENYVAPEDRLSYVTALAEWVHSMESPTATS